MGSVVISGVTYTIFGEHTGAGSADQFAGGSFAYASLWSSTNVDDQKRALIEATRILNRQPWQGAKTSGAQVLAWPRTGAAYADGTAVDASTIPSEVIEAAYELALAGIDNVAVFTGVSTADNTKKMEAKGVSIENFKPTAGGRWPGRVGELVNQFIDGNGASASSVGGASVAGTSCESNFDPCDEYGLTGPG